MKHERTVAKLAKKIADIFSATAKLRQRLDIKLRHDVRLILEQSSRASQRLFFGAFDIKLDQPQFFISIIRQVVVQRNRKKRLRASRLGMRRQRIFASIDAHVKL